MTLLTRLWREHRRLLLAFLAAVAVTLFFGVRLIFFTFYWMDPTHRDQHPAPWMTPGYIARSWHIPREDLIAALNIPAQTGHPRTLAEIAEDRGEPLADLLAEVEAALAELRAGTPGP